MEIKQQHKEAVIIGFWRMGASVYETMIIMEMPVYEIEGVIEEYKIFKASKKRKRYV